MRSSNRSTRIFQFPFRILGSPHSGIFTSASASGVSSSRRWRAFSIGRWPIDGRVPDHTVDSTLRDVLRRALDAPYYRECWDTAGLRTTDLERMTSDTLHRLPILKKQDLRRSHHGLCSESRDAPVREQLLSYFSSGSTGTPIQAICTRAGQQRFAAAREARSYRWAGTSIRRPRAMIGGQPVVATGRAEPARFTGTTSLNDKSTSRLTISRQPRSPVTSRDSTATGRRASRVTRFRSSSWRDSCSSRGFDSALCRAQP